MGDSNTTTPENESKKVSENRRKRLGQKIIVIRHGETDGNRLRRLQQPSIELSERGHEQARLVGERIQREYGKRVAKLFTSDLTRTKQTTQYIVEALEGSGHTFELHESHFLRERDFGDIRGLSFEDAIKHAPNLFDPEFKPPNGESFREFHRRIDRAWNIVKAHALLLEREDDVIVVVTHGLVKSSLSRYQFDHNGAIDNPSKTKFAFENTSVSLTTASSPFLVEVLNCVAHLPPHLKQESPGVTAKEIQGLRADTEQANSPSSKL